jgi:hypothetical protein
MAQSRCADSWICIKQKLHGGQVALAYSFKQCLMHVLEGHLLF